MRLGVALALAVAAAAASGASAAPPRAHVTVGCKEIYVGNPPSAALNGRDDLMLATISLTRLARLAGVSRSRPIRVASFASSDGQGAVTIAARGPGAVTFAFGQHAVAARTVTFLPCTGEIAGTPIGSMWKGTVTFARQGCYTLAADGGGAVARRTVPVGVAKRCD